ncbi:MULTISPECIES: ABC transporter permease [Congzhengia]|uniref:ABC transporter permease n=1 Tax=Congzhengia minquanensis TaxID=2763657 RepID=A0A926HYQ4_9FIRM|nr:ABC transporter permease [Congzhengia minquanensis]MBC8540380.1 ABC transporter permease [Congzhengia minquanensis]
MKSNAVLSEREVYLKKLQRKKRFILTAQVGLLVVLVALWEIMAQLGVIDSFITSQPSRVVKTIINLSSNDLLMHLGVTCTETIIGFVSGVLLGLVIASVLWWFKTFSQIFEPYLVILNSLPKIALGPIIIIWVGAGMKAIIVMALAISLVVTVMELLNGFNNTDKDKIKMARTFGATKAQIFTKIVLPSNVTTLVNSLKINLGLSLVGVIAGEFLVSKAGLGYLIVYGGQVFKLDLVMASVIILAVFAAIIYKLVLIFEKIVLKNRR